MAALFNPVHRRGEPVKWGLVSYTVAMFSIATVVTAMSLNIQSTSYIDNREFSSAEGVPKPGPYGYKASAQAEPTYVVPNLMFFINNWLADGLLVSCLFDAGSPTQGANVGSSLSSIAVT